MSFAVYAIVRSGGRQHKVSVGDVLQVDRLSSEPGSTVELAPLLVVDGGKVTAEPAKLARCRVTAEILGELKGPKIDIMTYKAKTGYRRRLGHRQRYTQVKVTDIATGDRKSENKAPAKKATDKGAAKSADEGAEKAGEKS